MKSSSHTPTKSVTRDGSTRARGGRPSGVGTRFILGSLVALWSGAGFATSIPLPRTVSHAIGEADLVFHGQVIAIAYASSAPTHHEPTGIPHTFVTYRIHRVLHGDPRTDEVTLRFLGGYDRTDDTYLVASVAPQFDLGDEDVLFVRDNGRSGCPLVSNYGGRFRIVDGQVYSESGQAVVLEADGTIRTGGRYDLPEVLTTRVEGETFLSNFDPEALPRPSDASSRDELVEGIALAARGVPRPHQSFESADRDVPFEVPDLRPVAMRDSVDASGATPR